MCDQRTAQPLGAGITRTVLSRRAKTRQLKERVEVQEEEQDHPFCSSRGFHMSFSMTVTVSVKSIPQYLRNGALANAIENDDGETFDVPDSCYKSDLTIKVTRICHCC
jgi:hypothetical protein